MSQEQLVENYKVALKNLAEAKRACDSAWASLKASEKAHEDAEKYLLECRGEVGKSSWALERFLFDEASK